MDNPITIEPAKPDDAQALLEIHAAAVHQTAAPYYSQEILNHWSRLPITSDRIDRIRQRWIENPDCHVMVARQNGQVVGFGFIDRDGELQSLYVHPDYGRRGVGASILATLEQAAIALGLSRLRLSASINAEDFYCKQGFKALSSGVYKLASGLEMPCIKMQKDLAPPAHPPAPKD